MNPRFYPQSSSFSLMALLMVLMLAFSSCSGPIESFSFDSPDGDRSISVSGERQGVAGPIMVTMTLSVPAGDKTFSFEHQAGSLTKDNCKVEWFNNTRANVTFTLDDDTSWEVECFLLEDEVQAIKKFNLDGQLFQH